jgi:hypothetical protein
LEFSLPGFGFGAPSVGGRGLLESGTTAGVTIVGFGVSELALPTLALEFSLPSSPADFTSIGLTSGIIF